MILNEPHQKFDSCFTTVALHGHLHRRVVAVLQQHIKTHMYLTKSLTFRWGAKFCLGCFVVSPFSSFESPGHVTTSPSTNGFT